MSTDPRGQYTGWRIAAIRSNETVGKCILARVRVVRHRKGSDTRGAHTHTHIHAYPFSHSPPHPSCFPLFFPHQPFIALSFSLASTVIRVLIISLRRAYHGCSSLIYAIYSGCVFALIVLPRGYNLPLRSEFFESLFEFPGNDRIKRSVNTDSGEINYLFQLITELKKYPQILSQNWKSQCYSLTNVIYVFYPLLLLSFS